MVGWRWCSFWIFLGHFGLFSGATFGEAATWQWPMEEVRCWPKRIEVQCLGSAPFLPSWFSEGVSPIASLPWRNVTSRVLFFTPDFWPIGTQNTWAMFEAGGIYVKFQRCTCGGQCCVEMPFFSNTCWNCMLFYHSLSWCHKVLGVVFKYSLVLIWRFGRTLIFRCMTFSLCRLPLQIHSPSLMAGT